MHEFVTPWIVLVFLYVLHCCTVHHTLTRDSILLWSWNYWRSKKHPGAGVEQGEHLQPCTLKYFLDWAATAAPVLVCPSVSPWASHHVNSAQPDCPWTEMECPCLHWLLVWAVLVMAVFISGKLHLSSNIFNRYVLFLFCLSAYFCSAIQIKGFFPSFLANLSTLTTITRVYLNSNIPPRKCGELCCRLGRVALWYLHIANLCWVCLRLIQWKPQTRGNLKVKNERSLKSKWDGRENVCQLEMSLCLGWPALITCTGSLQLI